MRMRVRGRQNPSWAARQFRGGRTPRQHRAVRQRGHQTASRAGDPAGSSLAVAQLGPEPGHAAAQSREVTTDGQREGG